MSLQEQLAQQQQQPVAAQLLRLRMGGGPPAAPKLWRPSRRLCAVLNDLREVRCKQGDLTATVRGSLPEAWWGALAGGGYILGSRLQLCQVSDFPPLYPTLLISVIVVITVIFVTMMFLLLLSLF